MGTTIVSCGLSTAETSVLTVAPDFGSTPSPCDLTCFFAFLFSLQQCQSFRDESSCYKNLVHQRCYCCTGCLVQIRIQVISPINDEDN